MIEINGKQYSFWSQFVERKNEWIGGILEDLDGCNIQTKITDIKLKPSGEDSAFFDVLGEDYDCGFDVQYGGVSCEEQSEEGWVGFLTRWGSKWRIKKKAA